jgi:hypothetical protein
MTSREKGQDFSFPVGKTASGESGQNDGGPVRGRGIGNFAEAGGKRERQWSKRFQPVVLPGLQGKGQVRQRSIFAALDFLLLFDQAKRRSRSAANERANVILEHRAREMPNKFVWA